MGLGRLVPEKALGCEGGHSAETPPVPRGFAGEGRAVQGAPGGNSSLWLRAGSGGQRRGGCFGIGSGPDLVQDERVIRVVTGLLVTVCLAGAAEPLPRVHGEPVGEAEYGWFEEQERTGVIQHFQSNLKVEYGPDFWDVKVKGVTPREMLRQRTLERVGRERVERRLFAELGLIRNGSFEEFLAGFERANREREAAQRAGKVVFGPVRFTPLQYYGYWKSNLRIEAINKLGRERWAAEDRKSWEKRYEELVEELVRRAKEKPKQGAQGIRGSGAPRSEERRVGKECPVLCRSRWSPYH